MKRSKHPIKEQQHSGKKNKALKAAWSDGGNKRKGKKGKKDRVIDVQFVTRVLKKRKTVEEK